MWRELQQRVCEMNQSGLEPKMCVREMKQREWLVEEEEEEEELGRV